MRAALITSYRAPLEISTVADPCCPPDGVVLKVLACGICRSDWHSWTGTDPDVFAPLKGQAQFINLAAGAISPQGEPH